MNDPLVVLTVGLAHALVAAPLSIPTAPATTRTAGIDATKFPSSWVGTWKGSCKFVSVGGSQTAPMEIIMELNVAPTNDGKRVSWESNPTRGVQKARLKKREAVPTVSRRGTFLKISRPALRVGPHPVLRRMAAR